MELRSLKYFVAVAENGSITAAANELHMSQPPLSTQIKLLEEELGARLFIRKPRNVELTDAGKIFYKRAQTIIDYVESACEEIHDFERGKEGTIRLGVSSSCNELILAFVQQVFSDSHPNVSYQIKEANTYELITALDRNIIDVALVRSPFEIDNSKYERIVIRQERLVALGSAGMFRNSVDEAEITMDELAELPIITYRRWRNILRSEFNAINRMPRFISEVENANTAVRWAQRGQGVAIIPESASNVNDDKMKVINIASETLQSTIFGVLRKGTYITACTENFWEQLKEWNSSKK